jgi:acyl-ACP thioesterase
MSEELVKEHIHEYFLTASECNAKQQMPFTMLAQRVIEVATEHANILGVGYDEMIKDNLAWVLSRLSIEMNRMPKVNESYRLITWIENYNRHFSERNMEVQAENGEVLGYIRTIWVAIDITTRTPGDLSKLASLAATVSDRPCPIAKQGRMRPLTEISQQSDYRFRYSDIDFNMHVNSVKYIELLINQWPLEYHLAHDISRFEIAYLQESHFGNDVKVNILQAENVADVEIAGENGVICRSRIAF